MDNIRNFAIIAHVDHGKSTLADRFLEITGRVKPGGHPDQFLDRNPISRERGVTIKLAPVRMIYRNPKSKILNPKQIQNSNDPNPKQKDWRNLYFENLNSEYILNLIDTPGHVDFSYEVERTLACVEGVILLVDATRGVQAQTIAHLNKAQELNLTVIAAVNKIDLPMARVEETKKQIAEFLKINKNEIYEVSAKTGQNVNKLLEAVIEKIPPPRAVDGDRLSTSPVRALIFDSYYDSHRGVIAFVRLFDGRLRPGTKLRLYASDTSFQVLEVGIFTPDLKPKDKLSVGEIGYVVTNLKDIRLVSVGDTIVDKTTTSPLPGYKKAKPMVYGSIFPVNPSDYLNLKNSLQKLFLNDASLTFEPIHSLALGAGFRIGFLGLFHAEIVQERLEREFNLDLVLTPAQVEFQPLQSKNNKGLKANFLEPYVKVMILTPAKFLGQVLKLCQDHRAKFVNMDNRSLVSLTYKMPMVEMMANFYDQLKTVSSGYASLDWEFAGFAPVEAGRLEILLNNKVVEEFSEMVVKERSFQRAKFLLKRIREAIPRQQFEVKIQAKYQGRIIASERIAPFRKDVTQKLYGGDRTRKDKLLKKQKKGKKAMKAVGQVRIPKEAFLKLFRRWL